MNNNVQSFVSYPPEIVLDVNSLPKLIYQLQNQIKITTPSIYL